MFKGNQSISLQENIIVVYGADRCAKEDILFDERMSRQMHQFVEAAARQHRDIVTDGRRAPNDDAFLQTTAFTHRRQVTDEHILAEMHIGIENGVGADDGIRADTRFLRAKFNFAGDAAGRDRRPADDSAR